jgi:hypothetical protein
MSRLLHAAARGARIQSRWVDETQWQTTGQFVFVDGMRPYRIHPDDEHLQYGPISTALRNYVLGLPLVETCLFSKLLLHADGDLNTLPPFNRYIFLLLMAEALADEGM